MSEKQPRKIQRLKKWRLGPLKRLREIKVKTGLSNKEVARALTTPTSSYSYNEQILRGMARPKGTDFVERFCELAAERCRTSGSIQEKKQRYLDEILGADNQPHAKKIQGRCWQWRLRPMGNRRDKINQALLGKAWVSEILREEVRLHCLGDYQLGDALNVDIVTEEIRRVRHENGRPGTRGNEYHAVLAPPSPLREAESITFEYYLADYATCCGVEVLIGKFPTLYAGALVTCSERQLLYLHRRSSRVRKYPNQLHTMSGNFIPAGEFDSETRLADTAQREIGEEMKVPIDVDAARYPSVLIHELESDRRIISYLGVDISAEESARIRSSGEGQVVPVPFRELDRFLAMEDFVKSGLINVLAWLALGGFTVGRGPGFDDKLAYEHLERWLNGIAPKIKT